jgi:hypothetical protein
MAETSIVPLITKLTELLGIGERTNSYSVLLAKIIRTLKI